MQPAERGKRRLNPHSHRFTIADDEAVQTLMNKLETSRAGQVDREALRRALHTAEEEYREASQRERKAFFHGMLTGYAVALKIGKLSRKI